MDKHDPQQVSNVYTSDEIPLRWLVETGPVEFSNLVLVLLPPPWHKGGWKWAAPHQTPV